MPTFVPLKMEIGYRCGFLTAMGTRFFRAHANTLAGIKFNFLTPQSHYQGLTTGRSPGVPGREGGDTPSHTLMHPAKNDYNNSAVTYTRCSLGGDTVCSPVEMGMPCRCRVSLRHY